MSLEKILKKITDDARDEADKIISESEEKSIEIKKIAQKEASELAEALMKEAESQGRLEASRLITQARLKKKINIVSCKKELIDEVLVRAFKKGGMEKKELRRKIIMKEGEREEPYEEEKLKEELRSQLENDIIGALKI